MTKYSAIILAATVSCGLASAAFAEEENDAGRALFSETSEPACALCHTLADVEATAEIGPNLDDFKPTLEQVRAAVTSGIGVMPAYEETLSEEEIEAVAKYVSEVTGGAKAAAADKDESKEDNNDDKT